MEWRSRGYRAEAKYRRGVYYLKLWQEPSDLPATVEQPPDGRGPVGASRCLRRRKATRKAGPAAVTDGAAAPDVTGDTAG
mgnify:CR=1 FL=1